MAEKKDNAMNEEIGLEELSGVFGGYGEKHGAPKGFCLQCGGEMLYKRQERIGGVNTGIYVCVNVNCTEEGKEKNNLEVRF